MLWPFSRWVLGNDDSSFFQSSEWQNRKTLLPILHSGDILVTDNLSLHKATQLQEFAASLSVGYLFLRTYSPDLNFIEKM